MPSSKLEVMEPRRAARIQSVFRFLSAFAAVLAAGAPLAGAKTLKMRLVDVPATLDWNGSARLAEAAVILNLCEGLYRVEAPSGKLVPAFGTGVKKSPEGTRYEFTIRKEAKWSDGRSIYAQDFVDSWLRVLSPQSESNYMHYLYDIVNAKEFHEGAVASEKVGIKALGDQVLSVNFKHSVQNWEANTAFWPLFPIRKDLIEKQGSNWSRAGTLVSSGPFVYDSYEQGKGMVLLRNPHFEGNQSNVDRVEISFVPNHEEALKRYDAGGFDLMADLPIQSGGALSKRKDYRKSTLLRVYYLGLNTGKFPMNNLHLRTAVLSSVDPSTILSVNPQRLKAAPALVPKELLTFKKAPTLPFHLKKAVQELKDSALVIGKNFKFRILTEEAEPYASAAIAVGEQIQKNLGIPVEVSSLRNQQFSAFASLGDYDAMVISWSAKIPNAKDFLLPFTSSSSANRTRFSNSLYDQWVEEGQNLKAEELLGVDAAVLKPLFFEDAGFLAKARVKNARLNHLGYPVLRDLNLND